MWFRYRPNMTFGDGIHLPQPSRTPNRRASYGTTSHFTQIYLCTTSARNGKGILIIALSGYSSGSDDVRQRQHLSVDKIAELPT